MKYNSAILFILLLVLACTRFMSCTFISVKLSLIILYLSVTFLWLFFFKLLFISNKKKKYYPSALYVFLLSILPIFSWINCLVFHNQSFIHSLMAFIPHWVFIVYFYLVYRKVNPDSIIRIVLVFAFIRTTLTFIEQITYPIAPFALRMDGFDETGVYRELEQRNGFYRFLIADAYNIVLFSCIYTFCKYLQYFNYKFLLFFLFCTFGLYMDGSRQVMVALAVTLLLYPILVKGGNKLKYVFIIVVICGLAYRYYDVIFSELAEKTESDTDDMGGRILSYAYFLKPGSWSETIFGHGLPYKDSSWGRYMQYMHEMKVRPHDVGIIGAGYMIGWLNVLVFLFYFWGVIRKYWKNIDTSVKLYALTIIIMQELLGDIGESDSLILK